MVSLDVIDKEIMEMETKDTTYAVIERLSWLYICRDHLRKESVRSTEPIDSYGDSEFLSAVSGSPLASVLRILDEHMDCIREVCPREYECIVQKINELK